MIFNSNALGQRILSLLAGWIFISSVSASEVLRQDDPFLQEFDTFLREKILPDIPGAAIVVIVDNRVQLIRAYGVREAGKNEPVTLDTLFRLASVSKSFAAAAAGLLIHENRLSWETPVQSLLGTVRFKDSGYGRRITVRNLLSQTTGLMPHAYTNLVQDHVPYRKIVSRLGEVDFICAPGSCYSYQNVVFSLTGDIIYSVTGKPYEVFVEENLFQPLGMTTASFGWESFTSAGNRVTPHVRGNNSDRWRPVKVNRNFYSIAPAAGINASILDLQQWLLANLGHRPEVLPVQVLEALHDKTVQTTRSQAHFDRMKKLGRTYYGLGWRVFDYGPDEGFVHHGGWVQGIVTEVIFHPRLNMGMAFLANAETRYAGDLVFRFLDLYQEYHRPIQMSKRD